MLCVRRSSPLVPCRCGNLHYTTEGADGSSTYSVFYSNAQKCDEPKIVCRKMQYKGAIVFKNVKIVI